MPECVFGTEQDLVTQLTAELLSESDPWRIEAHAVEFDYLRGRVDVIAISTEGEVVAFEAKLLRWKDALDQAYRNTCFAHRSYVVLPPKAAARAAQYSAEFERRGVGICSVDHGRLEVLLEARAAEPLQQVLSQRAVRAVEQAIQ